MAEQGCYTGGPDRAVGRRTVAVATALAGAVLALAACTNRQVYEAIQQNRQLECARLQGTQYEECMKAYSPEDGALMTRTPPL